MEELQNPQKEEESTDETLLRDKIILRREARRRKILENAKNRLEKLGRGSTDIQQPIVAKVEENCEFSDPEVEPDIIPEQHLQAPIHGDINDIFSSLNTDVGVDQKRHILLRSRAHVLLAVAIAYIYSILANEESIGCSVFVPAGICIVLELTYFREQRQINPITSLFITICGIKSQKANRILQILTTIQGLVVDVGISVFFCCTLTFLLVCVNEGFANLVKIK